MSSSWGASWGSSWGVSWGGGSAPASQGFWSGSPKRRKRKSERETVEDERRRLGIAVEASEVIEQVARAQVAAGELADAVSLTAELVAALEAAKIEWRREYDAALEAYREALRAYEIARLLEINGVYARIEQREQADNDAAIVLLLLTEH